MMNWCDPEDVFNEDGLLVVWMVANEALIWLSQVKSSTSIHVLRVPVQQSIVLISI